MEKFAIKILINAVALWVTSLIVTGISLNGNGTGQRVVTVLIVAVIFGLVNTFVKPLVKLLSLGLMILTLGLISIVINALMLLLTSAISGHFAVAFHVSGLKSALLGSLVISIVSMLMHVLIREERR